jgi:hypothetical protein
MNTDNYPAKAKASKALVIAPLLPVGVIFALDAFSRAQQDGPLAIVGAVMLAVYVLVVVEIFAVALGGLAIALLWRRIPFNLLICALTGGLVAALPFLIFGLISVFGEPINYDAWVDGRATVVDGVKTAYGRWQDLLAVLQIFGLGALGGAFFWRLCRPKKSETATAE